MKDSKFNARTEAGNISQFNKDDQWVKRNEFLEVNRISGEVRLRSDKTIIKNLRYYRDVDEVREYTVTKFEIPAKAKGKQLRSIPVKDDVEDYLSELPEKILELDDDTGLEELRSEEWYNLFGDGLDLYKDTYQISNKGRLMNIKTGKILKPSKRSWLRWINTSKGPLGYDLRKDGNRKTVSAHRLVALACIYNDDPENKTVVHHLDGDPTNNRADNLLWVSPQEHVEIHHAISVEMCNPNTLEVVQTFSSLSEASRITGFSIGNISQACNGKYTIANSHIYKDFYWRYKH